MRVSIVEDDNLLMTVMVAQLGHSGIAARSAGSGSLALAMIDEELPDVLILDVGLPDMTAWDIVDRLRQDARTRALPVIVHTCLDLTPDEENRLQLGPTRIVTKTTAFSDELHCLVSEIGRQCSIIKLPDDGTPTF